MHTVNTGVSTVIGLKSWKPEDIIVHEEIGSPNKAVYFFASFDLCNFTSIKTISTSWILIIATIYELLKSDKPFEMNFWKFLGDELLFYRKVHSIREIVELSKFADEFRDYMEYALNERVHLNEYSDILRVKAGVWISNVMELKHLHVNNLDNIVSNDISQSYMYLDEQTKRYDFVGVNIDEGFRMCSLASQNVLVVDPKIAYIVYNCKDINSSNQASAKTIDYISNFTSKLKVIARCDLKGVWGDLFFPFVLYSINPGMLSEYKIPDGVSAEKNGDGSLPTYTLDMLGSIFAESQKAITNLYDIKELLAMEANKGDIIAPIYDKGWIEEALMNLVKSQCAEGMSLEQIAEAAKIKVSELQELLNL